MIKLIKKCCYDNNIMFNSFWMCKLLNALCARDFSFEYTEIIVRWIATKGLWHGLFRIIAIIHEMLFDFIFVTKKWGESQIHNQTLK